MKGLQFKIDGDWAHFKKPETNNNPLSHDLIPKTALIGMIGAVLGIEREKMKSLFPQLSEDLLYGVELLKPVKKTSYGFTSHTAINPTAIKSPKAFEMLCDVSYKVCVGLYGERSQSIFYEFQKAILEGYAVYDPFLGIANCPAELTFISQGEFTMMGNGDFKTKGFVIANEHKLKIVGDDFRIGFDKLPTYQNNDFWNLPEKYVNVIYPECSHVLNVEGDYWEFIHDKEIEQWVLI